MKLITVQAKGNGSVEVNIGDRKLDCSNSEGPNGEKSVLLPVELLSASLGACICLMVDDYCRRNGYTDGQVQISLTCQMGSAPKRIEVITIDIELPRDFPPEKRSAVLKIAQACPIHTTITHPPQIDIDIVS